MSYTLTDIVNEYLVDIGAGQSNLFGRLYNYGVGFLRKKHFDVTGFPKIIELDIDSNDTAPLPIDYVNYMRIALCTNGRLISLGQNPNICLNQTYDECGNAISSQTNTNSNNLGTFGILGRPLIADNFRNGEFVGRLFGIGGEGNSIGEFRIDKTNAQIQFSGLLQTSSIILEYMSDVNVQNGDFEVHPFAIDALKMWIRYQYKMNADKPGGEQELAWKYFKIQNTLMKKRFGNSTLADWQAAFRSGDMAAPKM